MGEWEGSEDDARMLEQEVALMQAHGLRANGLGAEALEAARAVDGDGVTREVVRLELELELVALGPSVRERVLAAMHAAVASLRDERGLFVEAHTISPARASRRTGDDTGTSAGLAPAR